MDETEITPSSPEIVKDLDHNTPIPGANVKLTEAEIPTTSDRLYLGAGHAAHIPLNLIKPSDLYYVKSGEAYVIYASIDVDGLLNNEDFKANVHIPAATKFMGGKYGALNAQELIINFAEMQTRHDKHFQRIAMLKQRISRPKINEAEVEQAKNSIFSRYETDYNQSLAAKRLLEAAADKTSPWWKDLNDRVTEVLKPDEKGNPTPLEKQLESIQKEVDQVFASS